MILTNMKFKDKEHLKLRCFIVKVGPGVQKSAIYYFYNVKDYVYAAS